MNADRVTAPIAETDAEEVGRRLRALFQAMHTTGPHTVVVARYLDLLGDVQPAESVDPDVEGSWGWWAKIIMTGPSA